MAAGLLPAGRADQGWLQQQDRAERPADQDRVDRLAAALGPVDVVEVKPQREFIQRPAPPPSRTAPPAPRPRASAAGSGTPAARSPAPAGCPTPGGGCARRRCRRRTARRAGQRRPAPPRPALTALPGLGWVPAFAWIRRVMNRVMAKVTRNPISIHTAGARPVSTRTRWYQSTPQAYPAVTQRYRRAGRQEAVSAGLIRACRYSGQGPGRRAGCGCYRPEGRAARWGSARRRPRVRSARGGGPGRRGDVPVARGADGRGTGHPDRGPRRAGRAWLVGPGATAQPGLDDRPARRIAHRLRERRLGRRRSCLPAGHQGRQRPPAAGDRHRTRPPRRQPRPGRGLRVAAR